MTILCSQVYDMRVIALRCKVSQTSALLTKSQRFMALKTALIMWPGELFERKPEN